MSRPVMPSAVAQIRRDLCQGCACPLDPLDPCASCPIDRWGQWMRCEPDATAPADPAQGFPPAAAAPSNPTGVGTLLKSTLAKFFIESGPGCQCNARAAQMDHRGPEWCESNLELIVGWLKEEAIRRRLPFFPPAARLLIRRCIAKARALQPPCPNPADRDPITVAPEPIPSDH